MQVQITQDTQLGPVMDLLVKLVEHERCPVFLGNWASHGPQRLPPGRCGQGPEQVLPESVRMLQDGDGLRRGSRRRVIPLKPARRPLDSQPLRIPFPPITSGEMPQPPCDRREGRVASASDRTQDIGGRPVRVISTIGRGLCPADRAAARYRLPEVFVVIKPGQPAPGALVHVVRQPHDVSPGITHALDRTGVSSHEKVFARRNAGKKKGQASRVRDDPRAGSSMTGA